jgi:hypothetical protein
LLNSSNIGLTISSTAKWPTWKMCTLLIISPFFH